MAYSVLIVDDQAIPRQLFESIVNGSEQYKLAASIDMAEVADMYCARQQIDLILMDVVMSDGINGLEAAAKIKKSYPNIKIIILTSMPDAAFLTKAREAKVDSFWYKEVQDAPLLSVMDRTMAGEHIFPDKAPEVTLGLAKNTEFTARELQVLRMLVNGYTDKEISEQLEMSFHTVRFHINTLLQKTGCSSRTELAIKAAKSGIVVPEV